MCDDLPRHWIAHKTNTNFLRQRDRTGLGTLLIDHLVAVAEKVPSVEKAMLTCFASNARAMRFYERLGFGVDEFSPRERQLRGGKVVKPDYVILSRKTTKRGAGG